jgi:parvulin-like peptidyl-prolyl isomerase
LKKLSVLLVVVALGLAACGSGSGGGVAASVNGVDITVSEVEALLDPADGGTIPKQDFAGALGFLVQQQIITTAAESEFGIVIEESAIEEEANTIFEEAQGEGQTREEFLQAQGITEDLLRRFAHSQLLVTEISEMIEAEVAEPTDEEVEGLITEAEGLYCASHILVATEQEAIDVANRLEAGEDFASLAGELSTDTGSGAQGGDLGCQTSEAYVEPFAAALIAAEVDVPTAPVETDFGWHIILLREDELPTADEAREILTTEAVNEAANTWFTDQFESAEVTVESEFGTWQASPTPQVVPPTE